MSMIATPVAPSLPPPEEMKKINGQIRMAVWFISQVGSIERARRIFEAAVQQAAIVSELSEDTDTLPEKDDAPQAQKL